MIEAPEPPILRLQPRERAYLAALARDVPRKELAAREGITESAVNQVVQRAMRRLGAGTAIEAFRILGWLREE